MTHSAIATPTASLSLDALKTVRMPMRHWVLVGLTFLIVPGGSMLSLLLLHRLMKSAA